MKHKKLLKNILIYLGLLLIVSSSVLTRKLGGLDEIWIFNSSSLIAKRTFTI